jgi:hypothetical protein
MLYPYGDGFGVTLLVLRRGYCDKIVKKLSEKD